MNFHVPNELTLAQPAWVAEWVDATGSVATTPDARMALAIDLSRRNVARSTGGPFGAIVVERDSGRLVAAGVNVVHPGRCSHAHGEMMALALAEQARGTHDLASDGLPAHELVTSCEPCAMCYGAIPWSGVRSLICGARCDDAEAVGFDEGEKPDDWIQALQRRGITVTQDVRRAEAVKVLSDYKAQGGALYQPEA